MDWHNFSEHRLVQFLSEITNQPSLNFIVCNYLPTLTVLWVWNLGRARRLAHLYSVVSEGSGSSKRVAKWLHSSEGSFSHVPPTWCWLLAGMQLGL